MAFSSEEMTVLEMASMGEDMMSIGAWRPALQSLETKGFMVKIAGGYRDAETAWYRITEEGRKAFVAEESSEIAAMIGEHNARVRGAGPVIEGEIVDESA